MSQSLALDKANIMLLPSLIPLCGSCNALLKAHNCFGLSYEVRPCNIRLTCSLLVSVPHTYYASKKIQSTYNCFFFNSREMLDFYFS